MWNMDTRDVGDEIRWRLAGRDNHGAVAALIAEHLRRRRDFVLAGEDVPAEDVAQLQAALEARGVAMVDDGDGWLCVRAADTACSEAA
jgi:hypothetical protein